MIDTDTDLALSRVLQAPRSAIWKAWSNPHHFKKWWAPAPVKTAIRKFELRPGGGFHTVMTLPDGSEMDGGEGCFLDVAPEERVVFTDALSGGWRPNAEAFFTAIITMQDDPGGTFYTATALHKNDASRKAHLDMGFLDGWGAAIDQLEVLARDIAGAGS